MPKGRQGYLLQDYGAAVTRVWILHLGSSYQVHSDYKSTSSVTPMVEDIGWAQLEAHRPQAKAIMLYRIVNQLVDIQVTSLLIPLVPILEDMPIDSALCRPAVSTSQVFPLPVQYPSLKQPASWAHHSAFPRGLQGKDRRCNSLDQGYF